MTDTAGGDSESTQPALLEVCGLRAGYGDILAVRDVTLSVSPGKATVVLGPNGAGKSTLLLALAGIVKVSGGSITLDGAPLDSSPAHQRAASGLTLVEQGKKIFHRRTVEENLFLGGTWMSRAEMAVATEKAFERFPMLKTRRKQRASTLSGGQQQMLAIAQALIPGPKVIMLDEPSAGLAPVIVNELVVVVQQLKAEGTGVLLVEQLVDKGLSVADRVLVLERGRVVYSSDASGVTAESLHAAYFSTAHVAANSDSS
jgi:branched-chain amino acid transport system ATP-binding protein